MRVGAFVLLAGLAVAGCGPKTELDADGNPVVPGEVAETGDEKGDGFEIQWPGGSVKVGGDGGVDVKAPGVDVNTKPGEQVKVRTGDVDVDVDLKNKPDAGDDESAQSGVKDASDAEQVVAYRPKVELPGFVGQKKTLDRIPAGTHFTDSPPQGWTNIISFVEGKLDSGDVSAVSDTVAYYSKLFNLVKLANVVKDDAGKFELDKVAVGFSMKIKGVNTVVTSDSEDELGADLSIIGRGVLDGNVESLDKVQQIARNKTSMLIDAPAIMLKDGKHKEMIVRYFIWASPSNGQIGTVVWLLDSDPDSGATSNSYAISEDTVQYLPPNMVEERSMNVKADRFNILGVPKKDAFALVQIPQGRAYQYTDELKQVAGLKTYDQDSYAQLLSAMSRTLSAQ